MRPTISGVLSALSVVTVVSLVGCGSAEKYQKQPAPQPVITGSAGIRLPLDRVKWSRELTSALDAARLVVDMGDTLRGMAVADSLLLLAEGILDTLPDDVPLRKFLLLFVADGYSRLMKWESVRGNRVAVAELTNRFGALAARLKSRRDSLSVPPESARTGP